MYSYEKLQFVIDETQETLKEGTLTSRNICVYVPMYLTI